MSEHDNEAAPRHLWVTFNPDGTVGGFSDSAPADGNSVLMREMSPSDHRALQIGQAWARDSSLEAWFPLTAEKLQVTEKELVGLKFENQNLRGRLRAVLNAFGGLVGGQDVEVLMELAKAMRKFPTWPSDPLHALAVLGEEFGELTKAVLQSVYEPDKVKPDELRTEARQTAAMALRFLMSLDKPDCYQWQPSAQHKQGVGE